MKTLAAPKARNIKTSAAPKARNMKARGKREAQRNASPLVNENKLERSTESAKYHGSYFALSELHDHYALYQGRRASRCSALAPGFHIPRLWRWTMFGACPLALIFRPLPLDYVRRLPWLSYSAPLALHYARRLPWLSYSAPLALHCVRRFPWVSYSAPLALDCIRRSPLALIFRAFGAGLCSALAPSFHIPRL